MKVYFLIKAQKRSLVKIFGNFFSGRYFLENPIMPLSYRHHTLHEQ